MSSPKLSRVLSAASFRLTLIYAVIFVSATLALLFIGGFIVMWVLTEQLESDVRMEAKALESLYREQGVPGLITEIDVRAEDFAETGMSYGLIGGSGATGSRQVVAGNLPFTEFDPGWFEFAPEGEEDDDLSRGRAVQLSDQLWLIVAIDMDPVQDTWELMLGGTGWTLGVSLPLALICGAAMSAMVLRRIETINATTLKIRDGGMNSRVPVKGSGDEFDRLSAHINAMLDSIEALTRNIQQVSVGIAHDLRTPLTRVYNRLEALRSPPTPADLQCRNGLSKTVEGALEEIGGVLNTFDALLRIGQIEAGTRRAGFQLFDLSKMVAEISETYEVVASESDKTLTAEIAEGCRIRGDRALLVQMVANVVENAIEHSPAMSQISLKLSRPESRPCLTVWDSGPGIPEEEHENVFKRFYRLDPSRGSRGNGLGLSIVRSIANLHEIEVRMRNLRPGFNIEFNFPFAAAS